MSLEEIGRLDRLTQEHSQMARECRELLFAAVIEHYGLVEHATVLRSEGTTGVFLALFNYQHGVPWVTVRVTDPPELAGKRVHFYQPWEIVPPTGEL